MSSVLEINDLETLDDYRLLWRSLLARTPGVSFAQSLDWFEQFWHHFGPAGTGDCQQMRVLIVHAVDKPIGILPLVVRHEPKLIGTRSWRTLRTLAYPAYDNHFACGPLGGSATATLLAGLRHIESTPREWDLLELSAIDHDQVDRGRTPRALQQVGLDAIAEDQATLVRIDLSDSWATYWASHTAEQRDEMRRVERELSNRGDIRFVRHRPLGAAHEESDPRWDLYDACVAIARQNQCEANWHDEADLDSDFLRDSHQVAVQAGAVDMNLLFVDQRPIAFAYNYHYEGRVTGLISGANGEFARSGADEFLIHKMVRDGAARGDQTYDLDATARNVAAQWQNAMTVTRRHTHYPALAWKAQTLRWARQVRDWIRGKDSPPEGTATSQEAIAS